jgi:hypothetical protein
MLANRGFLWCSWRPASGSTAMPPNSTILRLLITATLSLAGGSLAAKAQTLNYDFIQGISPDKKLGLQISCSSYPLDEKDIDPSLITAVKLVALPAKTIVMTIPQSYSGKAPDLVWSADSNWLAFSVASGPRVSDSYVYHRSETGFAAFQTENLRVDIEGDVKNEYVTPIRWLKPGLLLLEDSVIFRGGGDATYRFSAVFDQKADKFRITARKKVHS